LQLIRTLDPNGVLAPGSYVQSTEFKAISF
jgi:hypothetical protein